MRPWWKRRQQPADRPGLHSELWPELGRLSDGDTVMRPGQRRAADVLAESTEPLPFVQPLKWRRSRRGRS